MKISKRVNIIAVLMTAILVVLGFIMVNTEPVSADGETATEDVSVRVADIALGAGFPGAKMQLLSEDGTVLEEWTSAKNYIIKSELTIGETYTIHMLTPPDDYTSISGVDMSFGIGYDMDFKIVRNENGTSLPLRKWTPTNRQSFCILRQSVVGTYVSYQNNVLSHIAHANIPFRILSP